MMEACSLDHPMLDGVFPLHETSDMVLVIRIRRIIAGNHPDLAKIIMDHYRFWYHDKMHETSQVFWTENHIIMSQSSEYLLREFLGLSIPPELQQRLETFLELKLSLGMAEFLSPVYYPFTIVSLLNLYDFTKQSNMKAKCHALLDQMSNQILSVCLPDGSIVSPSGRSYARHRSATQGHHISLFINYLMTKKTLVPEPGPESALKEAMTTTTYLPSDSVYENFKAEVRDVELPLSPTWRELFEFLDKRREIMSLEDRVSTLWSHGAYAHPQAVLDILPFMDKVDLWSHPHFKAAAPARKWLGILCPACLIGSCIRCLSHSCMIRPFVMGALLTGARLVVHKEGTVLLSSLSHGFNAGLPAFQQWPWAVNMSGIPIWCSFGPVDSGGLGGLGNAHAAAEMSTARVMPLMRQRGNVLHAVYLSRSCVLSIWNRNLRPRVRWPVGEMDEHGTLEVEPRRTVPEGSWFPQIFCRRDAVPLNVWRWGRKESAVVAWTVVGLEVTLLVRDLKTSNESLEQFLASIRREYGAQIGSPTTEKVAATEGEGTKVGGGGEGSGTANSSTSSVSGAAAVEGAEGLLYRHSPVTVQQEAAASQI